MNIASLRLGIGRTDSRSDIITLAPAAALQATLERSGPEFRPGDPLPPLWHWLYFLPRHRQSDIGPDGHPRADSLLSHVPLPRRMWAGSRLRFLHPLRIGEAAEKTAKLINVEHKQGRSGELVFVQVRHEIRNAAGLALVEEQDIVYRQGAGPASAASLATVNPRTSTWEAKVVPDEVLLFRYSALSFNAHRIHYDHPYATGVEGYPGLVVHGPLVATLLAALLERHCPHARLSEMTIRAIRPVFARRALGLFGEPGSDGLVSLWAADNEGVPNMEISTVIAPAVQEGAL